MDTQSATKPRRVAVTGGRDFNNADLVDQALSEHLGATDTLVHGAARGADTLAHLWAKQRGIRIELFPAEWEKHGSAAGPIRNQAMVDSAPDLLVAFPGGAGTAHMVSAALRAGIPVVFAAGA